MKNLKAAKKVGMKRVINGGVNKIMHQTINGGRKNEKKKNGVGGERALILVGWRPEGETARGIW